MTNRQAQCKRVFVAIKISASLAEQITEWEKKLRNLPVRWLAEKNMHVTLIPPWYELDVDKVKGALNQVGARISTFSLEFHRVSYGPNPRAPRLIWAEGQTPQKLADLVASLSNHLEGRLNAATGTMPKQGKPFHLHLTLARFKESNFSARGGLVPNPLAVSLPNPPRELAEPACGELAEPTFAVKELNEKVLWRDNVSSFVLMESHLSSAGADYTALHEVKLQPAAG